MLEQIIVSTDYENADGLKTGSTYLICQTPNGTRDPLFAEVTFEAKSLADVLRSLKESTMCGEPAYLASCRGRVTEHQPESAGHLILNFGGSRYLFEISKTFETCYPPESAAKKAEPTRAI